MSGRLARLRLTGRPAAILKTILFTLVVPGTVTVLVPRGLLAPPGGDAGVLTFGALRIVGAPLIGLGALLYLRCAWDFAVTGLGTPAPLDPPRVVVVRGPYRYVRNPMYLGILSILFGEALFFESVRLLGYAALFAVSFHLFVILYEEPTLRGKFGDSYERYRREVPRWLPRRPR